MQGSTPGQQADFPLRAFKAHNTTDLRAINQTYGEQRRRLPRFGQGKSGARIESNRISGSTGRAEQSNFLSRSLLHSHEMRDIQMRNSNPAITSRDVCDCFACSSPGREENFDLAAKPGSIFFSLSCVFRC